MPEDRSYRYCALCQLVAGTIPCDRLWEDELVFAFLAAAPLVPGHALLIPKAHHNSLTTLDQATLARLFATATSLGQALARAAGGDGFNLHVANGACAGQEYPHVAVHLIPRHPTDGLHWPWQCRPYPSDAARAELLARLHERLAKGAPHG